MGKHQLEVAAAAKLKEEAEEKTVAAKTHLAEKIKAAADKSTHEANVKKAAAESLLKKIDNAKCTKHAGCKGPTGYCCPTLDTNKMHLGSTKLDGESLGCCGAVEDEDLTIEDDEDDEEGEKEALNSAPVEEPTTEFGTSMLIAFVGGVVGAVISALVPVCWRPRTIVQTPIL